jgi:hypothetical protein
MSQDQHIEHITNLPFFFILGRPRSGTTLLRTLLDIHPQVNIPLENSGMIHLHFKYRRLRHWDHETRKQLLADFRSQKFMESWKLDWDSIESLSAQCPPDQLSFEKLIRLIYFHYQSEFTKEDLNCLGDKSPINSLYANRIVRIFPNAKFIHLVRDYRANLASMSKHHVFSPSRTVILMQWRKSVTQIRRLAEKHPGRFLQVRYEDLVSDPLSSYEKVCDFLHIRFSADLLDPQYRKKALRKIYNQDFLNQWQPGLTGRISTSHIHKWETELDTPEVRKADYIAGRTGRLYHYEPRHARFGILFILITELKKLLFHLNELNRYLYDRLPYRMKDRIKNRRFILSYRIIALYRRCLGKN